MYATYEQMPPPGSIPHLDWLNGLSLNLSENPADFMQSTQAATTLARLTRRHRTYWPMEEALISNSIGIDSERMELNGIWPKDRYFESLLNIYGTFPYKGDMAPLKKKKSVEKFEDFSDPNPPGINSLILGGRPYPDSNVHKDVLYKLQIPLTEALLHDRQRPITARYEIRPPKTMARYFGAEPPTPEIQIYNPISFEEYGENDSNVFYKSFRLAIRDLHFLIHQQMQNRNSLVSMPRSSAKSLGNLALPFRKAA